MSWKTKVKGFGLPAVTLLVLGLAAVACGAPDRAPEAGATPESAALEAEEFATEASSMDEVEGLAGTQWQLVEFQSMDDATGTVRPEDPGLYTMQLNADGTVNMRLNCNRASGSWSAEPSADPSNGSFEFGPLAMTRALCPPPSLDEQIASHSEYVRSYLLQDGRLYLSLMADGGIYAWEPFSEVVEVPFENEPDPDIEAAILEASPDYTQEIVDIDGRKARYIYAYYDLNGDGAEELFVYMLGSIFCGTGGCNFLLFSQEDGGWRPINNFPITREPVVVSSEATQGWRNLVRLESGGGAPSSWVTHTFNGSEYVEHERVSGDEAPEGVRVLAGVFTFEDGAVLEPQD